MRLTGHHIFLNAAAAAAAGTAALVVDYRNCVFSYATDGGGDANGTVKFQGSIQEVGDEPSDWGTGPTVSNMWDYIEVIDLEDGAAIDGDTGIAVSGADDYRLAEANINGLTWINARLTARSEGEFTVKGFFYSNK